MDRSAVFHRVVDLTAAEQDQITWFNDSSGSQCLTYQNTRHVRVGNPDVNRCDIGAFPVFTADISEFVTIQNHAERRAGG